tara:strand:- start:309 stop:458 length:150 start_codon:yes stop_codon:yes gene_type:complete
MRKDTKTHYANLVGQRLPMDKFNKPGLSTGITPEVEEFVVQQQFQIYEV